MTVCHRILLLIVLSQFVFVLIDMKPGIRKKRVMFGLPTEAGDRDEYYPHFRYFVYLAKPAWIGQIDENPSWLQKWTKVGLNPLPKMMHCGGSLLTPSIVQTACHCLATYTKRKGNFTIGTPFNAWEDRIYSFVGSNIIWELYYLLVPNHYIIHAACRQVLYGQAEIHDYGVIVNKESIYERAEGAEISYAPVYRGVDIRNFYYIAIKKEYTCLFIGFGIWSSTTVDGEVQILSPASEVLRWGWRSLRSYKDCLALSCPREIQMLGLYDYREYVTNACFSTTTMDGYKHAAFQGDSGGPVSCNNLYFAIQSAGKFVDNRRGYGNWAGPIAYTSFENAVESRTDFIKYCNEYGVSKPEVRPTSPSNPYKPTPPPPRRSQCPPKIILHHFMILSSTLFTWLYFHY